MAGPNSPRPYTSAADLPSYREMNTQLRAMKVFTIFSPKLRLQMRDVERQLRDLVHVVDSFYDLLAAIGYFMANWIPAASRRCFRFREYEAERALIEIYQAPDWLPFWVARIARDPAPSQWVPTG